jgi:hypothetical protein
MSKTVKDKQTPFGVLRRLLRTLNLVSERPQMLGVLFIPNSLCHVPSGCLYPEYPDSSWISWRLLIDAHKSPSLFTKRCLSLDSFFCGRIWQWCPMRHGQKGDGSQSHHAPVGALCFRRCADICDRDDMVIPHVDQNMLASRGQFVRALYPFAHKSLTTRLRSMPPSRVSNGFALPHLQASHVAVVTRSRP